jgi:hypothetical protein
MGFLNQKPVKYFILPTDPDTVKIVTLSDFRQIELSKW